MIKLTSQQYNDFEDEFIYRIKRKVASGDCTQEAATRQELGIIMEKLGVLEPVTRIYMMNPDAKVKANLVDKEPDPKDILSSYMNTKQETLKLRAKLKASKKQMMELLYGPDKKGYAWDDRDAVVNFMNDLLGETPPDFWPVNEDNRIYIREGNWRLKLFFIEEDGQHADLSYAKDDHTAWVIRGEDGKFKNFDIGGS